MSFLLLRTTDCCLCHFYFHLWYKQKPSRKKHCLSILQCLTECLKIRIAATCLHCWWLSFFFLERFYQQNVKAFNHLFPCSRHSWLISLSFSEQLKLAKHLWVSQMWTISQWIKLFKLFIHISFVNVTFYLHLFII